MKHKLCLHGLGIKHQAQLLGAVKKLLPACNVKYKVKEEFLKITICINIVWPDFLLAAVLT